MKNKGLGHLKTKLFTNKNPLKNVGFGGSQGHFLVVDDCGCRHAYTYVCLFVFF